MTLTELLGNIVAFLLTLLVLSYLIRDNPLYRFAVHAFVGVAAGYATIVAFQSVLAPRFVELNQALAGGFDQGDWVTFVLAIIPWILGLFILLKVIPGLAPVGNFAMAFMVGVGAALAVGGAIVGTIFSQLQASWVDPFPNSGIDFGLLLSCTFAPIGTAAVLLYFFYTGLPGGRGERWRLMTPVTLVGQAFLTIALAALYAGAVAASLAILVDRVGFMYSFLTGPATDSFLGLIGGG